MDSFNLFKFYRLNNNFRSCLKEDYLYFSSTKDLNDPFDCNVDMQSVIKRAALKTEGNAREQLIHLLKNIDQLTELTDKTKEFGICSFTLEMNEPLMWAHYAENYSGVCVMYEIPSSMVGKEPRGVWGCSKVDYADNPVTNFIVS